MRMSLSRNWINSCRSVDDQCWEVVHPWNRSCCSTAVGIFLAMYPRCVRVYLPLFLVSDLVRHGFDVKRIMSHTLHNTIRSCTFLSIQGTLVFPLSCLLRRLLGCFYVYTPVLIPMLCSALLGISLEREERRPALASYICTEAIYGLFYSLKTKGFVKSVPSGEVILFSFALSVLCQAMEQCGKDVSISLLRFLLNPYFPIINGSIVNSICRTTALKYHPKTAFILSVAETCCWSFFIGYCGRSLSSMVTALLKGKKSSDLIKPWLYRNNVRLGYFLATLTGVYKVSLAVFRQFLPLSKASLLAGALAGLFMLLYKSPFTALYIAVKAIEILYGKIVKAGYLPSARHASVPIYALSTAILLHLLCYEPDHVSKQYQSFLVSTTRGRISQFNTQRLIPLGAIPSKHHGAKPDVDLENRRQKHRT